MDMTVVFGALMFVFGIAVGAFLMMLWLYYLHGHK